MDNTENIISLCTGYGGLDEGIRMGAELQGRRIREIAYVEIEAFAVANLVAKMEKGAISSVPVWTNLKTFNAEPFRGKVHGIIGGYPCQPFSMAGQRQGTEDPRHLWPYIREIVDTIRPVWCFFENVSGHISLGYEEVYRSLRDMGYSVEAGLYTAAEVGAPHKRERLFILAYRNGLRGQKKELQAGTGIQGRFASESSGIQSGEPAELGNAEHDGCIAEQKCEESEAPSNGGGKKGKNLSRQPERTGRPRTGKSVQTELANTPSLRTQSQPEKAWRRDKGQPRVANNCSHERWPSRPGEPQYEWEHPRTATQEEIKSAMGLPVDGPGFREDLLRALGNGVVPQQAAKAWIELWNEASH